MKNLPLSQAMRNAEQVHTHARLIALENLVIALLSTASDKQLELIREMAIYISPRPGFTEHPLTIQAATKMVSIVKRASHFKRAQNL